MGSIPCRGAIFFGSRVRGENRPNSDLDLYYLVQHAACGDIEKFTGLFEARTGVRTDFIGALEYPSEEIGRKIWAWDKLRSKKYPFLIASPFKEVRETAAEIPERTYLT